MKWLAAMLLIATTASAQSTYYVSKNETRRPWRTLPKGSDSHSCEQAKSQSTARATINGGIACLKSGDTLRVGPGTYNELLLASYSGNTTCAAGDAEVQQPCAIIPNGVSQDKPTKIIGDGDAVVSPNRSLPGGGGILTLYDMSRYMHFEGLRFIAAGGAQGANLGNSQYVTLHGNEFAGGPASTGGLIKGSYNSRYFNITSNEVHHAGQGCDPRVQKSPPCPHGMYVCGQDHWIADNYVHHNSYYGIQVSCEQGGIARVIVAMNRVEYNQGVGIRIAGSDNKAFANKLIYNGLGMTAGGSALIAHNTFDGIHPQTAYDDPFGIWFDGSNITVINNLFTQQKSAWYMMQMKQGGDFVPVNTGKVHHNGCDVSGNVGCTNVHPISEWFTNQASGDYTLASNSPAKAAGVDANVEVDIIHHPYITYDLGSYAASGVTPEPPQPQPPTGIVLACSGDLGASGKITLTCTQQE